MPFRVFYACKQFRAIYDLIGGTAAQKIRLYNWLAVFFSINL